MKKLKITVIVFVILSIGFIYSPFDNLPSSVKLTKTTYMANRIFSKIFANKKEEFEEEFKEENKEYNTYRMLHIDNYLAQGIEQKDIKNTLTKMKLSTKQRLYPDLIDTIKDFGDGNWEYEWELLGDYYLNIANEKKTRNAFMKASMYYRLGAFPGTVNDGFNINSKHVIRLYEKALKAYEQAGKFLEIPLEKVVVDINGQKVHGYLHLPKEAKTIVVPAVLMTNGSDFFQIELVQFVEMFNKKGIAVMTFDLGGIGASYKTTLTADTKIHSKFLDFLVNDSRIDSSNIGALGKSFGGNMATRLAFLESKRIKAVVNMCGPIEQAFSIPKKILVKNIPKMTSNSLFSRLESSSLKGDENPLKSFGFVSSGLIKESQTTTTPIYSINNGDDPVNPIWEMELLTKISGGKMTIADGHGHCPPSKYYLNAVDWLSDKISE